MAAERKLKKDNVLKSELLEFFALSAGIFAIVLTLGATFYVAGLWAGLTSIAVLVALVVFVYTPSKGEILVWIFLGLGIISFVLLILAIFGVF